MLALFAGVALWQASLRQPTGAASGTGSLSVEEATSPASRVLRAATWNIHGAKGRDRRVDLPRVAAHLGGFDFVGLNEVRGAAFLSTHDQAAELGRQLDAESLFLPFERRFGRDDFGNGVINRTGVRAWVRMPLPCTGVKGHGNVTLLNVHHHGRTVHILVTHIDHGADRERQLEFVYELFQGLSEPVILMGDLNTRSDQMPLSQWLKQPGIVDPLAACGVASPEKRIDWILVRGLHCLAAGVTETDASDHPLVWAELEFPKVTVEGETGNPK